MLLEPPMKQKQPPQICLNSQPLEVHSDDIPIDEDTSEQAAEIQLPSANEFKDKPKMDRSAIVADLDVEAQQSYLNRSNEKNQQQVLPMSTVHQPGTLASELLLRNSRIGLKEGYTSLKNKHYQDELKIRKELA